MLRCNFGVLEEIKDPDTLCVSGLCKKEEMQQGKSSHKLTDPLASESMYSSRMITWKIIKGNQNKNHRPRVSFKEILGLFQGYSLDEALGMLNDSC